MIQARKMEEGDKTPTLYNFFEDQYNFNDLSRNVYSGMNDYISTFRKRKRNKYEEQFREAVTNLMSGIKDGTITFEDGYYNDSLGRYRNAEDKDKDVYGWAANYIYNNMQRIPKYNKQTTTTKKYDNTLLSKELSNIIFGSENGNLSYFWDLDRPDPETNISGVGERLKVLNEAISQINPDILLKDYSQEDRNRVKAQLQQVTSALSNGQLNPGELLTLGKTFGGIDWNNWLKTDFNKTSQEQQEPSEEKGLSKEKFFEYVSSTHPLYQGNLESVTLDNTVQSEELEQLARKLSGYDNRTLQSIDLDRLDDDSKSVTLDFLISRHLLPQSDGVYIIPNSLKDETVLTYNPRTQQLSRKRTHELSYYRKQWTDDYIQQYGTPSDQLSQYFVEFKKSGGIIKAQDGTQLWYSELAAAGDYNPEKYQYSYDTSRLVDADMSDNMYIPWKSNIAGLGVGRYKPSEENNREYAQKIEATPYYQKFGKDLLNPDGTFTDMGLAWAKAVDAQLPKGSTATFFDEKGNPRTSWTVKNQDIYGRKPQTFDKLADYVNYVRNDQIIGSRHNVFLNQGNRYFYRDQNGVRHWVDPNEISKYVVSTNPVPQWSDDGTIRWNDYELTGLKSTPKSPAEPEDDSKGSQVFPLTGETKTPKNNNFRQIMAGLTPELIGIGRLSASLRTNNKVFKVLDKSLRPVLRNTYERYSPITGAFGEMQLKNRQAADLRRQASRPFTSDASLQLAGQLEADRQARDLEYQGFLADDKEIKRTQEAALARQEDNMARRSEVSNFNRASINQTNREKAQLEATRLRHNWQSVDNFLQGVEGRLRTSLAERRAIRQNASMQAAQTRYQEFLQRFNEDYKRRHPNATQETMLNDPEYIRTVQDLRRRYQYDTYNIGLGRYYRDPYAGIYDKDNIPTYESILYSKNGGRLRPSIMTMINKVIKNESYT